MLQHLKERMRHINRFFFAVLQAGTSVFCRICSWQGRRFMKSGVCPRCGSRARLRLIPYSISHFGLDFRSGALLHVGPNLSETAYLFQHYAPEPYYRMDTASRPLINCPGDLLKIPFESKTIQHILIWHVLEHIPDDRKAIAEMYRVLCPGGTLLVSVPIVPPGRSTTYEDNSVPRERFTDVFGHFDHVRACGLDYGKRFEEVGFSVSALHIKALPKEETDFYGLSNSHVAWCCTK